MKKSVHWGIENSALKTQIHTVVFIIRSVVYKIHSVVFIIHTVDFSSQRIIFYFSMHRQYVFKALSVHIEYGMLSSVQANVLLQPTMTKATVCLVK